jgi:hypothetical protein
MRLERRLSKARGQKFQGILRVRGLLRRDVQGLLFSFGYIFAFSSLKL